jgi:hypothetical protein
MQRQTMFRRGPRRVRTHDNGVREKQIHAPCAGTRVAVGTFRGRYFVLPARKKVAVVPRPLAFRRLARSLDPVPFIATARRRPITEQNRDWLRLPLPWRLDPFGTPAFPLEVRCVIGPAS